MKRNLVRRLGYLTAAVVLFALAGCAATGSATDPQTTAASYDRAHADWDWGDDAEEDAYEAWDWDGEAAEAAYDEAAVEWKYAQEGAAQLPLLTPANEQGAKMIYQVEMSLQTTEFDQGTRNLLNVVSEMGGYVQSSLIEGRSLRDPEMERYARYTVKIPSEDLAEFLVMMEDAYNLVYLRQDSRDITVQYDTTQSRLEILQEQERQLLERLAAAENGDDKTIGQLQRELAAIRQQIVTHNASGSGMDKKITYSTVTILLYEVIFFDDASQTVTFGMRFGQTAVQSWNGFVSFCQGFVLVLVAILPSLVVIAVVVVGAGFLRKKILASGWYTSRRERQLQARKQTAEAARKAFAKPMEGTEDDLPPPIQ